MSPATPLSSTLGSVRVDRWLWAVRLYRTRSEATAACRGGHVRIDGTPAKASSPLKIGARVEAHVAQRDRIVEVTRLIEKRVGAAVAQQCFRDHSPPPPEPTAPPIFTRDPGTGRPTKRDRRALDRFRNQQF